MSKTAEELIAHLEAGGLIARGEPERPEFLRFEIYGENRIKYLRIQVRELLGALADEVERLRGICDVAIKGVGAPIAHHLAQEALRQLRTAKPKD